MTTIIPQCMFCIHHHGNLTCDAFQEGIPDKILLNEHDHRKPYPNDSGITYERKK